MESNLAVLGVKEVKGKLYVSSRDVAKIFEKEHAHVLRDIKELKTSEEFRQSNFGLTSYKDEQNKKQPEYLLTKDGFTVLAMGYNGEKAMAFKEAYIKRFNEMERVITESLMARYASKCIRRQLTDAIQEHELNDHYHGHAYSLLTDLVYKYSLGGTCKQLKKHYELDEKDNIRDYITEEELKKVKRVEKLVESYVDLGFDYEQIRNSLEQHFHVIKSIDNRYDK